MPNLNTGGDSSFGGFWSSGFAYTNKTDSANGSFSNLYGVKAYTQVTATQQNFVVGQDGGVIKLKSPNNTVNGFYITNTTYAYKVIRNGDSFFRANSEIPLALVRHHHCPWFYPDFLKITARGYLNGILKPDSAEFISPIFVSVTMLRITLLMPGSGLILLHWVLWR